MELLTEGAVISVTSSKPKQWLNNITQKSQYILSLLKSLIMYSDNDRNNQHNYLIFFTVNVKT